MELMLTVSNLKSDFSDLILESSLKSIINNGRMIKNVRDSIESQLKYQFKNVEYVRGKKGEKSHFLVSGKYSNLEGYKSSGSYSMITDEDINCFLKFISQQNEYKFLSNNSKVINDFGVLELLSRCFKLSNESLSIKSGYLKGYASFNGLNIAEEYNNIERQRSSDINVLVELVRKKLRDQAGKYVEWTLKKNNVNYYNTYYKIEVIEDENGKETERIISSNETDYNLYKQKYSELLSQLKQLGQGVRIAEKNTEKMMIEEYGYKLIFKKYVFFDNEKLNTNNFILEDCKKRLFDRLIISVTKRQNEFIPKSEIEPNEYVDFRLLKCDEYSKIMIYFYEAIFQYSSIIEEVKKVLEDLEIINNINVLLERFQEFLNLESIQALRELQGSSNISESIKFLIKNTNIRENISIWDGLTSWSSSMNAYDYIIYKKSNDKILDICFRDKISKIKIWNSLEKTFKEAENLVKKLDIRVNNYEELLDNLPHGFVLKLNEVMREYEKTIENSEYYFDKIDYAGIAA